MAISKIVPASLENTLADIWYLNAPYSNTADVQTFITTGLNQLNQTGTGIVGSMSQSSGVFTFPQTGVYRVFFSGMFYSNTNTARYCSPQILVSTDGGSSYTIPTLGYGGLTAIIASSNTFVQVACETLINVTSVSNVKVKFATNTSNTINVAGGTSQLNSYMTFTRLGNSA